LKEIKEGREDEEEDASIFWITSRKTENIGISKRKHFFGIM